MWEEEMCKEELRNEQLRQEIEDIELRHDIEDVVNVFWLNFS